VFSRQIVHIRWDPIIRLSGAREQPLLRSDRSGEVQAPTILTLGTQERTHPRHRPRVSNTYPMVLGQKKRTKYRLPFCLQTMFCCVSQHKKGKYWIHLKYVFFPQCPQWLSTTSHEEGKATHKRTGKSSVSDNVKNILFVKKTKHCLGNNSSLCWIIDKVIYKTREVAWNVNLQLQNVIVIVWVKRCSSELDRILYDYKLVDVILSIIKWSHHHMHVPLFTNH
jgi:hypothetical protein